jgi:hypothetical protein
MDKRQENREGPNGQDCIATPENLSLADLLHRREKGLSEWLKDNAPECGKEQRHLNEGSIERIYWHYGYMVAIRDVLAQITSTSTSKH